MDNMEPEILEEDLIIADEFTMSDMKLPVCCFKNQDRSQTYIGRWCGSSFPSVGPGDVFRELIVSDVIPVTVSWRVFPQAKGHHMECADLINRNQRIFFMEMILPLPYVEDSRWVHAEKFRNYIRRNVERNGGDLDMVQVLSPLRAKTEAG